MPFKPPTLDEVSEHVREKKYRFDAAAFVDHYTANGWMVGKTKMKDWRAACRTWERRCDEYAPRRGTKPDMHVGARNPPQRDGWNEHGFHTDDIARYGGDHPHELWDAYVSYVTETEVPERFEAWRDSGKDHVE